jgi:glycosyltransferase involved in cell wall biosynthesis
MKIIQFNNLYFPYERGGTERIAKIIFDYLTVEGNNVITVTTRPWFRGQSGQQNGIYYLQSLYYDLGKFPKVFRLFWHIWEFFNPIKFMQILSILRKEKPDLIISHNTEGLGGLIFCALNLSGAKHLHYLHDVQLLHPSGLMFWGKEDLLDNVWSKIYQFLQGFFTRKIDFIISPSEWLLNLHISRGYFSRAKTVKIFNPLMSVNNNIFINKDNGKIKFIFVGMIEEHKGIFFLLDTLAKLADSDVCWGLDIIGGGNQVEKLENKIKSSGLSGKIRYLGQKTHNETNKAISLSDCLLAPSLCYENSPTVISEAASFGLYAIGTGFGGAKEICDYFGFPTFIPNDRNSLLNKLQYILGNREKIKKIGDKAQIKSKTLESVEYFKKLKDIFDIL